ncbi:hypothetical protein RI129_012257 [Pyrocoelia pectoralis]|uniref:Uncharacterized protein n=1 Tax=Pyrocoelia pectoralis TaxID=417401 RepID=A0AAN7UXG2_9COLE
MMLTARNIVGKVKYMMGRSPQDWRLILETEPKCIYIPRNFLGPPKYQTTNFSAGHRCTDRSAFPRHHSTHNISSRSSIVAGKLSAVSTASRRIWLGVIASASVGF